VVSVEWVRVEGTGLESYMGEGDGFENCKGIAHGSILVIVPENASVEKMQTCTVLNILI
jgi:hypothetical protein